MKTENVLVLGDLKLTVESLMPSPGGKSETTTYNEEADAPPKAKKRKVPNREV